MTKYTDKEYYMDDFLVDKLDLAIKRYEHSRDNLFICDGSEGDGKTTMTLGCAYYLAWKLNKSFSVDNLFFDAEKMLKFAAETEGQVIIWDEACMNAMAMQWQNKLQQKLIKVLMMARKKKHFYFFNIPKFRKLNEYIVDRAIGMIHVYSPDLIKQGCFVYFKKDQMAWLYEQHKERGKKSYRLGWTFRGKFSNPQNLIDNEEYEKRKDAAIRSIFKDEPQANGIDYKRKLAELKKAIADNEEFSTSQKARVCGVTPRSVERWKKGLNIGGVDLSSTGATT